MSVSDRITILTNIRTAIRQKLVGKGITDAGTHDYADFADDIESIQSGGATKSYDQEIYDSLSAAGFSITEIYVSSNGTDIIVPHTLGRVPVRAYLWRKGGYSDVQNKFQFGYCRNANFADDVENRAVWCYGFSNDIIYKNQTSEMCKVIYASRIRTNTQTGFWCFASPTDESVTVRNSGNAQPVVNTSYYVGVI